MTNSTYTWRRRWGMNLGQISRREASALITAPPSLPLYCFAMVQTSVLLTCQYFLY